VVKVYDSVSLKVPKKVLREVRKLKAKMMLESEKHVSDGEAMEKIVSVATAHEDEVLGKRHKAQKSLLDMAGMIKGGKRFNAEKEIDRVVYELDRK